MVTRASGAAGCAMPSPIPPSRWPTGCQRAGSTSVPTVDQSSSRLGVPAGFGRRSNRAGKGGSHVHDASQETDRELVRAVGAARRDRAVVSVGHEIFVIASRNGRWTRERLYALSAAIPADDRLNSALPDWSGRLWFVTRRHGIVGVLDPRSGRVLGTSRTDEALGNSFAVDDTGGVFVVTDRAQYRFDSGRDGAPKVQLASALRQPRDPEAGPIRRRLGDDADVDGPQVPLDHRQRRPDEGGRDAARQAPATRQAPRGMRAARLPQGREGERELDHRRRQVDDRGEQLRLLPAPGCDLERTHHDSRSRASGPQARRHRLPNGLAEPRDLTEHGAEALVGERPDLSLYEASAHARRVVSDGGGLPHRQDGLAAADGTGPPFNVHYAGRAISPRGVLCTGVLGGTVALADG